MKNLSLKTIALIGLAAFAATHASAGSITLNEPQSVSIQSAGVPADLFDGLEKFLLEGQEGPWSGGFANGGYVLSNATAPDDAYLVYKGYASGKGDVRAVAKVTLADAKTDTDGAGILFARDADTNTYIAVSIMGDKSISIYEKGPTGLNRIYNKLKRGVVKDGENEIVITRADGKVVIEVNGQEIATLDGPILFNGTSGGIFTVGTGTYVFSSYRTLTRG